MIVPVPFNRLEIPPVTLPDQSQAIKNFKKGMVRLINWIHVNRIPTFVVGIFFMILVVKPIIDWCFAGH